jgi:serine/threonine protein kinase
VISDLLPTDPESVGPYRLLGRLGAGGMGQVYLASSASGRRAAVKVIRSELASDRAFRSRFSQEVAAARTVGGIYTALVVDADTEGPMPWLATAYVPGPSLAEAVDTQGPLPVESVLRLAAGLAEGLQAIHRAGLVHRDLKPSNVLLEHDGPKVIDFGISRAVDASSHTATGTVLGSPGYMSPEQAHSSNVGPQSDVFSLGAVLVFAATGEGPWGIGFGHALIYRLIHQPPDLSRVPAELRSLVERCLAKDPAERPSPGELLAELGGGISDAWLPASVSGAFDVYESQSPAPDGSDAPGASDAPDASDALGASEPAALQAPPVNGAGSTEVVQPGRPAATQPADGAAERDVADTRDVAVMVAAASAAPGRADRAGHPGQVDPAAQAHQVHLLDRRDQVRRGRIGQARLIGGVTAAATVAVVVTVVLLLTSSAPPARKDPIAGGSAPVLIGESSPTVTGSATRAATKSADRPKPHHSLATTATRSPSITPSSTTQSATTQSATPPAATSAATTPTATHSTTSPTKHSEGSVPLSVASYSGATMYACGDAPAQGTTTTSATFTLYNDSTTTVEIAGQPVQAGGSWSPGGAIGALWTVSNGSGACLDVFKQTGTGEVIVT